MSNYPWEIDHQKRIDCPSTARRKPIPGLQALPQVCFDLAGMAAPVPWRHSRPTQSHK